MINFLNLEVLWSSNVSGMMLEQNGLFGFLQFPDTISNQCVDIMVLLFCVLQNLHWWKMLSSHGIRISRLFCRTLVCGYATAPAAVKPFYYQQLLEHEKKIDTPYKKLTGVCCL